jgi:hypothetical protein
MVKKSRPKARTLRAPRAPRRIPAIVRVAVVEKPNGGFFVEPPVAFVAHGDEFRIINTTKEPLRFGIISRQPFGAATKIKVGRNPRLTKPGAAVTVHFPRVYGRSFSYTITTASGRPAFGNSDPVIIVDNP